MKNCYFVVLMQHNFLCKMGNLNEGVYKYLRYLSFYKKCLYEKIKLFEEIYIYIYVPFSFSNFFLLNRINSDMQKL